MSYLYVKWNKVGAAVCPLTFASLEHSCVSMATPGTEACDAVGGALRPKWREWPSQAIRRVLPERVTFVMRRPKTDTTPRHEIHWSAVCSRRPLADDLWSIPFSSRKPREEGEPLIEYAQKKGYRLVNPSVSQALGSSHCHRGETHCRHTVGAPHAIDSQSIFWRTMRSSVQVL